MIRHRFVLQDGEGFMLQLPVGPKSLIGNELGEFSRL